MKDNMDMQSFMLNKHLLIFNVIKTQKYQSMSVKLDEKL